MKAESVENSTRAASNGRRAKEEGGGGAAGSSTFESRLAEKSDEISAQDRRELRSDTINYDAQRMIGHGSFGAVFLAKIVETDETVAIKKVLQDKRFKNRELQIMKQLQKQPHPYIVTLRHHFVSKGAKQDEVYLNLVLEFIPETVYSVSKHYIRAKEPFPLHSIKLYMYQLSRALAHIHGMGICHRDIKPQNLLVDPARQVLKLCDFGSAKALVRGEPNIAYICSRYYRAPELIFGSTDYTTAIDVWSQGCVLAELLLGSPIFPGSSGVDQLVEIIKVLGTPTKEELKSMNPNYQEFKFPQIRAHPWASIFKSTTSADAMDLARVMLAYIPERRCKAIEACGHVLFDDFRNPSTRMPDGSPLPVELFQLTDEELALAPGMAAVLLQGQSAAAAAAAVGSGGVGSGGEGVSESVSAMAVDGSLVSPSDAVEATAGGEGGAGQGLKTGGGDGGTSDPVPSTL